MSKATIINTIDSIDDIYLMFSNCNIITKI